MSCLCQIYNWVKQAHARLISYYIRVYVFSSLGATEIQNYIAIMAQTNCTLFCAQISTAKKSNSKSNNETIFCYFQVDNISKWITIRSINAYIFFSVKLCVQIIKTLIKWFCTQCSSKARIYAYISRGFLFVTVHANNVHFGSKSCQNAIFASVLLCPLCNYVQKRPILQH